MAKEKPDLVYGTLDMLILKALQHDARHGLAIADRIQQMSKDILCVEQGSLYPALYRLEAQGWIKGACREDWRKKFPDDFRPSPHPGNRRQARSIP